MELYDIIDILKWAIPTLIALVSLIYAIKQRNIVKKEISRKRYLESALSNLNEVIEPLKDMKVSPLSDIDSLAEELEDTYFDAEVIASEIIKASFETKKKKVNLAVSYRLRLWERDKKSSEKTSRVIEKFDEMSPEWLFNLFHSDKPSFFVESRTTIQGYKKRVDNELDFSDFYSLICWLIEAKKKLSKYEEVYESISPNCLKNLNQLIKEGIEEIFKTISKPKTIQIDVDKFSTIDEIIEFLIEEVLNYSTLARKLSRISEIISELTEVRKELFLKIA